MTSTDSRCLEDLILARLSPKTKSRLSPSELARSLYSYAELEWTLPEWREQVASALQSLRHGGFVEERGLVITDAGMTRLRDALELEAPPRAKSWRDFKGKYLTRLVLPGGKRGAVNPALEVLADQLEAPSGARGTPSAIVNAWLARKLELKGSKVTLGTIRAELLARELGVPVKDFEQVVRLSVAKLAGSRSAHPDDVLRAVTARWLQGGARKLPAERRSDRPPASSPPPRDDSKEARLVDKVFRAASGPGARRFGPNKVFIASVWEALKRDPEVLALGERGFKQALADAHRRGSLVLARADLVSAMNPDDVSASEIQHLNATYHFIQLEGEA